MSNINSLYNNGAGSLASFFTGQEQSASRQKQEQAMQYERQKMQQEAALHPLDVRQKQATLDQMAAQLPGLQGQSASMVAKGVEDTSGLAQKLALNLEKISGQIGEEGMKKLKQEGERALQAAAAMANLPPHTHKQVFQQFSQQFGGDPNSPMSKAILAMPDAEFAKGLKALGEGMALASSKFIQDTSLKKQENDSQEKINKQNNDARLEAERIKAEARAKAEGIRAASRQQGLSFEKQLNLLTAIPETERTPDDWNRMTELKTMMYTKSSLSGNATTPEILGQETPTDRAKRLAQPENRPATPAPNAVAGDDPKAFAKANGLPYDESKYHYKMVNGQLLKKPK